MLDSKDRKILNLLQLDSRMMLKDIAKAIGLSIDSTHKRMKKMQKEGVFFPTILIDPKKIGYPLAVDVKVKLKDIDEKRYNEFIGFLTEHPNVIAVLTASGDYDITIPLIAKDYNQLDKLRLEIRQKFKDLIADWKAAVNLKVYKFERYDMERL